LSVGLFLSSIHPVTSTLLQGTRYVRVVVAVTYATFAVQAGLVWLLMGRAGLVGAAWASVLAQAFALVLLMGSAVRVGLLEPGRLIPPRVVAACALLAALAPLLLRLKSVLRPSAPAVIAASVLLALAYAVAAWRYVLDASTRVALLSALDRWR